MLPPPLRAVLVHSPLCLHYTNARGMGTIVGAPVCDLSGEVPPGPPPKRSFPEGSGKRIVFQSDSFRSPTVVLHDPFSTTPYSLTHRLFPFRDYDCCFRVPRCRSHRSRGTCAADALSGVAIRRTSNGRRVPPSATDPSVAGNRLSHLENSFCTHHRERRTSKATLHRARR